MSVVRIGNFSRVPATETKVNAKPQQKKRTRKPPFTNAVDIQNCYLVVLQLANAAQAWLDENKVSIKDAAVKFNLSQYTLKRVITPILHTVRLPTGVTVHKIREIIVWGYQNGYSLDKFIGLYPEQMRSVVQEPTTDINLQVYIPELSITQAVELVENMQPFQSDAREALRKSFEAFKTELQSAQALGLAVTMINIKR